MPNKRLSITAPGTNIGRHRTVHSPPIMVNAKNTGITAKAAATVADPLTNVT